MKNKSLFSISCDFYALRDLTNDIEFNEETGEIINNDEAINDLFSDIQGELSDKLDNTAYVIKELLADAEALKKEKLRLGKKQTAFENKAEMLKKLMLGALQASGEKKLVTLKHSFTTRNSKSVNILNEEEIERSYMIPKFAIDKKKIGESLKTGELVKGAELLEKTTLNIK